MILFPSHIKTYISYYSILSPTPTCTWILSLRSLSERFHSPPYRLKPALTVLALLTHTHTHTLSRGQTTLWNNYSLNWQLINLKSIWPWRANLETESQSCPDKELGWRSERTNVAGSKIIGWCWLIATPVQKYHAVSVIWIKTGCVFVNISSVCLELLVCSIAPYQTTDDLFAELDIYVLISLSF